jgi:CheY-specific phosphatase CheX
LSRIRCSIFIKLHNRQIDANVEHYIDATSGRFGIRGMPRTLVDAELAQRFLAAVLNQLRDTIGVEAEVVVREEPAEPAESIAVRLEFSGDVKGPVTWVFPAQIALELVRRLMADPDPDPSLAVDGATELANILTGRASAILDNHGIRCMFGAPHIHVGELPHGLRTRMWTNDGPIDLVLSMKRGQTTEIIRVLAHGA